MELHVFLRRLQGLVGAPPRGSCGARTTLVLLVLLRMVTLIFAMEDAVPPFFKREPPHSQLHLEGNRLVLTCLAEGSWPLEFRWLFNDAEVAPFSTENRYFIPSLHRSDAGSYQCVVRNRLGTLLQRRTEVLVAYLGDFEEVGERTLSVERGEAIIIDPPQIGSYPQPQVTWFREGRKVSPTSRIVVTLSNQLVVMLVGSGDAGTYHAQVMNERNGETKTGPPIVLTVRESESNVHSSTPDVVVTPRNASVVAGAAEASFECIPFVRPLRQFSIVWKRNGAPVTSSLSDHDRRLKLVNPSPEDAGRYDCEVWLTGSGRPPLIRTAYLSVSEVPQFTKEPEKRIPGIVGSELDIPCQASGLPVPSVTWYHDGLPVGLASIDGRYQVLPHSSLRIHRLEEKDSGMLQCFAKNSAGEVQTHAHLTVRSFPPNITQGPVDSTVIEGSSVSLLCETSGAPKPTITWLRGGKTLSPGSPRFSVTSSGSLHLNPAELRDSGTYTCRAKNYRGEALARAHLVVWVRTRIVIPPRDQNVVKGMTVALHCGVTHDPVVPVRFDWKKDGVAVEPELVPRYSLDSDGSLHITRTWSADIGIYTCHVRSTAGNDSKSARVDVREAPHAPRSVSARIGSSEARSIDISWLSGYDGNTPLLRYILEASENGSPWIILQSDVAPALTNLTLRGLTPAQSYHFRLTGVNGVGAGEPSSETDRTVLPEEPPDASPLNLLASGQTNQTIALLWQPPPEIQWNGVLKGYLIRYRLSGLPSDYLYKNVPNPDVMSFRLEDLNVWTSYDVEIAAYNAAGLGPYCAAVTERTHEGVPKAAPERMQAQAVNSTTLRLRWYPPRRSLIYGIVQGYKLLAWRSETPKEVMVRILSPPSPAAQPGPVKGLITGLKKFTEYYVSVLCFTTPGDGPRSPPLRLHTAEDVPGPVGNLRFSEILDTSLKISWEEPHDKNGILFGYKVSWVEFNKTHNRVTHNLSNSTLEYRVTGLAALTTYVIEISARTTVGSGPVTATSISSGIPPELPGAPSNLIVSNIAARSVLLQFRAGFDGKTSILKWVVEAQKETGESAEEDWETIYEQKNNPSARSLEVPNLVPFTNYRFRLRQTNIMGTSPPSKVTRHVKTSPAAPDYAPTSIMVRTASETSLWVRWAPLQENDFNAPASSLGYRVRCRRANRLTTPPLILTVEDVSEREVTVQGLRPWADYEIFVQAYNRMGSGPWAGPVTGHTSESVPSNGPDNLTANATSPTTVLITWGQVSEDERNGLILGYKVWFREEGARNDFVHKIVRGNHSHSFLLMGLRRYTPYEIQLQAYTRAGDGARSPPVYIRTLDSVPGPPFALYFPDVQLTSVRLAWQPPTEPNGVILGYKVAHWLDSGDSRSSPLAEVKPEARHFFAGGLIPNSIYHFRVTARTRKGWGEPAEVIVVNTESRDHPDAPSKLAIPKLWVGSRSVTMSWDPGNDHSAPLRHYILQVRSLPDGHWFTHSPWVPPHLTTYTADRLKPFTAYIFRLAVQNDVGQSHWSEASPAVVTLQAAPEKPPSIISIVPRTTSSVLVKWEPPAEDYVNGVLLGYHVLYRELSLGSHQQPALPPNHALTPRIPSPIQAQLLAKYNVRTVNNSAATDYELARLTKFRQYEICIRAYTVAGDGPTTVPLQVYVGEAVPSAPPHSLTVRPVSSSQLELTWETPPTDSQHGLIQGYKVMYTEVSPRSNGVERVKILFLPETSIRIKKLRGYTVYSVSVSIYNSAGEGPRSEPITAQTLAAEPSAPGFIRFSDITTNSLNVSWGEPESPNGILESYRLIYKPSSPVHGVSKIVTVDVRPEAPRWLRVKDLVKGMTYQFQVKGRTFAYGPEAKANVSTAPLEGSPGPPGTPRVIRHDSEVSLQWEEGKPSRSPMTSYMIEARPSDEGLWDILIKDLQKDQTSYTFSNTLLKPGISYTFRIVPVNSYGCGLPSEPSEPYSVFTDSAFYDEWWFLVVVALSGLILILLLIFVLVIRGQSQKHLRRGNSGMTPKAGTLAHEEMVSLDDRFTASLELNERQLPVKNTFGRRSALQARSPPRPSPGSLRYTDEDLPAEYDSIKKPDSNGSLNEKLSEIPESPSEEEGDPDKIEERDTTHSFVNHYISDPTYYNSWRRQQRDLLRPKVQCSLEGERGEAEGANHVVKSPYASSDGDIRMAASFGPGLAGFSSFV